MYLRGDGTNDSVLGRELHKNRLGLSPPNGLGEDHAASGVSGSGRPVAPVAGRSRDRECDMKLTATRTVRRINGPFEAFWSR
jgi:hypothetical protein